MTVVDKRELEVNEDNHSYIISICICRPIYIEDGDYWNCNVQIIEPDKSFVKGVGGADSLQSLMNAITYLKSEVSKLQTQHGDNITYVGITNLLL